MKNKTFILAFGVLLCSVSGAAKAQGNLQFNRVVDTCVVFNNPSNTSSCVYTVPNGKVFKLEKMSNSSGGYFVNVYFNAGSCSSATNNRGYYAVTYTSTNTTTAGNSFPLWLSAGTSVYATISASAGTVNFNFDGIEFNVVP